ncbi:MAG: hydrogenase maturation protease [Acidobacteriota bacterium]|nr:hydrogenase maturation protease [Acidobacteriota bacterium]
MTPAVEKLNHILSGRPCIVGMGNILRRDDAVGVRIAEGLKKRAPAEASAAVISAEDVVENHIFTIAATECPNVILIDAVASGGEPGAIVFGPLEELAEVTWNVSTHKPALGVCQKILADRGKRVYLLGVVAADVGWGRGLTSEVEKSAAALEDLIAGILTSRREKETRSA